jgi:RNA polymerase sigma-70 factor (family 1)
MDKKLYSTSVSSDDSSQDLTTNGHNTGTLVWEDREIFIRKVFEEDPKKGCELLFKQYYLPMCSHAVRFIYSKEIAQDLVSEIFCAIWQKQLYLNITISYRAYLFTAVRNRSLKYINKEFGKIDNTIDVADLDHLSSLPTPQQFMQYNELYAKIEKTIQLLTPQSQKIFLMSRFEGKKYQAIANELHISIKTVEAHVSKALDNLRKAVRDEIIIVIIILFNPFA